MFGAVSGPLADWIDPAPATRTVLLLGAATLPFAAARTVWVSASQGIQSC